MALSFRDYLQDRQDPMIFRTAGDEVGDKTDLSSYLDAASQAMWKAVETFSASLDPLYQTYRAGYGTGPRFPTIQGGGSRHVVGELVLNLRGLDDNVGWGAQALSELSKKVLRNKTMSGTAETTKRLGDTTTYIRERIDPLYTQIEAMFADERNDGGQGHSFSFKNLRELVALKSQTDWFAEVSQYIVETIEAFTKMNNLKIPKRKRSW